ncbi:MAG: antibiotic biosynthesis monooxygenase [Streptomycetaceae bacterium]|nr:antibiotic biosynthesis monooxygenase [Streptomycetaceae bacterium]
MTTVALVAKVKAREGKGDELIAAFQPIFQQAEKEPGTLLYALNRSKDDPDLFWVSELYADEAALAAHSGSEAMAAAGPALAGLIAESELIIGAPVLATGLPA